MIRLIHQRLKDWQDRLGARFGADISTPEARRAAIWHFHLSDHAFLRVWWSNLAQIAPGVWRSNQPSPQRLARHAADGFKTIVNLRGAAQQSFWLFEREAATVHGMTLHDLNMSARQAPSRTRLLALVDLMRNAQRPLLIHCKSGADRTGLAAALYLICIEGRSLPEAQAQLSWRFMHLSSGRTGILDHFLRVYAREAENRDIALLDWIATDYDPVELTESYKRFQAGGDW